MRLRPVAAIVVALVLAAPARASEPGQPLDCSDWVFLEAGQQLMESGDALLDLGETASSAADLSELVDLL